MSTQTLPIVSDDPATQAIYEESRSKGMSHQFALMCAARQPPGTKGTDRAFLANKNNREFEGMSKVQREWMEAEARKGGVNPNGKFYMQSLANRPGDPEAWVSDLSDVKRVCESRGMGCEGAITVKRQDYDAHPKEGKYEVDDKLVERYTQEIITENPEVAPTPKERVELKEQVREQLTPDY